MYFCQAYNQSTIEEFRKIASDFLYQNEAQYNLMVGLMESEQEKFLFTIHQDQKLIGCALQTPPYNLVVTKDLSEAALEALSETVKKYGLVLPGVVGPSEFSEAFARIWSGVNHCQYKLAMDQKIYKLTKVIQPQQIKGIIRLPTDDEYSTLLQYFTDFVFEAIPEEERHPERTKSNFDRRIAGKNILILEVEGEIVSFVSSARPTKNGQCIAPVYTPKKFRGNGYASTLVAAMSQNILDAGKSFSCLYTDMSNPTSNSIYQKVGYQEIATSRHFVFY